MKYPILIVLLLILLWTVASAHAASRPIVWDFESENTGWRPREETITLSRVKHPDAPKVGSTSLRIQGRITGGWNYAASDTHPIEAGQLYRLSAWLRVDRVGPATPMPYLKCEFVAADTTRDLGIVTTDVYSRAQMGTWQRLVLEFRAPEGVTGCWAALEKGGTNPMEIDAHLDDVTLEPISKSSQFQQYRLDPIPTHLVNARGQHPRLYLDKADVTTLRQAIQTTHAALWQEVRAQADRAVERGAPAYREDDGWSGREQLWQRNVGNTMPALAMAYLMTGDKKYLDSATEWALASCSYPTWGLGNIDGMDLATGHQLFGLGIVYDWCYNDLDASARQTIRETLVQRTSRMFEAAATGQAWWRRSYLQNHLWVNICGMAVSGMALFDEVDDAILWIGLPLDKFQKTMAALGSDGASHEGVGYWGYGVEYMLKFMHLARQRLNVDMYDIDWWRNTAAYRQYLALPRNAWTRRNNVVDIADCPRGNWYGPDYLLRGLAREYRDGYAQWLAEQIDEANVDSPEARWLNLIWYDPALPPTPPNTRPTFHHFTDMDIVSARSDWSGNESLAVFKCGPYIGHHAVKSFDYDPGGGHVHPDANHFVLFGNGEWLIRDDGYRAKWTGQHNTLLIGNQGQRGEGRQWFQGGQLLGQSAQPRIIHANTTPELDIATGDATAAYPKELGLQRYVRHLLFLKPDILIVVDDIALNEPKDLELRFHPEQTEAEQTGSTVLMQGEKTQLRLQQLTPQGVDLTAENVAAEGRHGDTDSHMFTVRLTASARSRWQNAVALSWSPLKSEPANITLEVSGNVWTFTSANRSVSLNLSTNEVVQHP